MEPKWCRFKGKC